MVTDHRKRRYAQRLANETRRRTRLAPIIWEALRIVARDEHTTINQILEQALIDYFDLTVEYKRRKRR